MAFKSPIGFICVSLLFSETLYAANDIDIDSGNSLINISGSTSFTSTDDSAILGVDQITGVWSTNTSSSVSVSTSVAGTNLQNGDINFNGSLDYDGPNYFGKTFNMSAHNNINISGSIYDSNALQNNFLNLNLTPDSDAIAGGMVVLSGSIDKASVNVTGDISISSTGTFRGGLLANTVINEGQIFVDYGDIEVTSMTVGTGAANSGNMTIDNAFGATINDSLTINSGGTVNVINGGLYVDSIDNSAGGSFTYTQGVLYIFNDGVVIGNDGLLGNAVTLSDNRHLGAYDLTVDNGATLDVTGGYNVFSGTSVGTGFIENNGTLSVSGGLLGTNSSFTNHSGATFNLNGGQLSVGSISNAGTFNYTGGDLTVFYSDLNISDIANSSGNLTVNSSMNVAADGHNIVIGTGNTLTLNGGNIYANNIISGGGSLNFASGSLGVDSLSIGSGGLLGNNVSLNSSKSLSTGDINVASGGSLSVNGGSQNIGNITNNGNVSIDSNGLDLGYGTGTYTQNAGATTVDGILTADTVNIQGGTLKGSGGIIGNTVIGDGGILNAGNSPGSMSFDGSLTLTENGTLQFEIDDNITSGFDFDQLIFNSNNLDIFSSAFQGGDILFDLFDGVDITDLTSIFNINDFFVASDGFAEFGLFELLGYGALANVSFLASDGEFNYILNLNELDGSFSVESVSSVPAPAAVWLFGSGLIGLIGIARRKA